MQRAVIGDIAHAALDLRNEIFGIVWCFKILNIFQGSQHLNFFIDFVLKGTVVTILRICQPLLS